MTAAISSTMGIQATITRTNRPCSSPSFPHHRVIAAAPPHELWPWFFDRNEQSSLLMGPFYKDMKVESTHYKYDHCVYSQCQFWGAVILNLCHFFNKYGDHIWDDHKEEFNNRSYLVPMFGPHRFF